MYALGRGTDRAPAVPICCPMGYSRTTVEECNGKTYEGRVSRHHGFPAANAQKDHSFKDNGSRYQ